MKTLTLGTLMLCCCMAGFAQMRNSQTQPPAASTPSTFPQDQTGQPSPATPSNPSNPSAMPPDTSASGQTAQTSNSQATTVVGCLSQSSDGDFMIADDSGNRYQLRGDTSKLSSFIGNEIRVDGVAMSNSASNTGSMASSSNDLSAGSATQLNVGTIHKISETCTEAK